MSVTARYGIALLFAWLASFHFIQTLMHKIPTEVHPPHVLDTDTAVLPLDVIISGSLTNTAPLSICHSAQFSSVAQSCLTLCDPIDCSMPGFPVHHQLLELAQTLVHRVGDAIQPSHPLLSPSPPAFSLSQHQGLFQNESVLCIRWPKYWSFSLSISPSKEYSGLISFGTDWFDLLAVQGTLKTLHYS